MQDDGEAKYDAAPDVAGAPEVRLHRIGVIPTFEVMESQLDTFDEIVSAESTALGLLTFAAGAALGLLGTIIAAGAMSPVRTAVLASLFVVMLLETLRAWFAWRAAKAARPTLLARIRSQNERQRTMSTPRPS